MHNNRDNYFCNFNEYVQILYIALSYILCHLITIFRHIFHIPKLWVLGDLTYSRVDNGYFTVCGRCLNCKLLVSIKRIDVKRVNEYGNKLYTK